MHTHTHTHIRTHTHMQVLMECRSAGAPSGAVEPNVAWVRLLKVSTHAGGARLCMFVYVGVGMGVGV